MKSTVYFAGVRARSFQDNKQNRIVRLFDAAGLDEVVQKGDLTAIKIHFGEKGNDSYVNPVLVRPIAEKIRSLGAKPFLTDTNTLYGGSRANAVDHLQTAAEHGFGQAVAGAPAIIADGLQGDNFREVSIDRKHFRIVKIAAEIASANSMIVVSHFKAHLPAGFGGAIKILGMGCAPALGKAEQHSAKPISTQSYAAAAAPAWTAARSEPSRWEKRYRQSITIYAQAAASACAFARLTPWTSTGL